MRITRRSESLWEWKDGKAIPLGTYDLSRDSIAAYNAARADGKDVALMSDEAGEKEAAKLFSDIDLHELIAGERNGKAGSLQTTDYGFVIARPPNVVMLANDQWGANERNDPEVEEVWESTGITIIGPDETIYTGQRFVSGTAVRKKNTKSAKPQAVMVVDKKGRKWMIDGHHYAIACRIKKKPFLAYVMDYASAKEMLDEIYSDE
jgi:hypothetical protein